MVASLSAKKFTINDYLPNGGNRQSEKAMKAMILATRKPMSLRRCLQPRVCALRGTAGHWPGKTLANLTGGKILLLDGSRCGSIIH